MQNIQTAKSQMLSVSKQDYYETSGHWIEQIHYHQHEDKGNEQGTLGSPGSSF